MLVSQRHFSTLVARDLRWIYTGHKSFYDEGKCLNKCISDAQFSEYNCSLVSNIRNCSIYEYYKHFGAFTSQEDLVRYRNDNCKHCFPRCMQTKYKVQLMTINSNAPSFLLYIYFRNLKYTVMKEIALIELDQLLSYIGGLLGLFIGASVLSVLEILDWLSVQICQRFYRKCKEVQNWTASKPMHVWTRKRVEFDSYCSLTSRVVVLWVNLVLNTILNNWYKPFLHICFM